MVSTDTPPDDVSLADETACAIERKKVRAFAALVDPDGSASLAVEPGSLAERETRGAVRLRGAPFGADRRRPARGDPGGSRGANGWLVQVFARTAIGRDGASI